MIEVIPNQKNVKPNITFKNGMLFINCSQESIDKELDRRTKRKNT